MKVNLLNNNYPKNNEKGAGIRKMGLEKFKKMTNLKAYHLTFESRKFLPRCLLLVLGILSLRKSLEQHTEGYHTMTSTAGLLESNFQIQNLVKKSNQSDNELYLSGHWNRSLNLPSLLQNWAISPSLMEFLWLIPSLSY